jgi:pretoxin HINT domain-containing protein
MNGRVYDYNLGRFLSVDPFIQSPGNSQSMNPYSYIMNNPLAGMDPSGYVSCEEGKTCEIDVEDIEKVEITKDGDAIVTTSDGESYKVETVNGKEASGSYKAAYETITEIGSKIGNMMFGHISGNLDKADSDYTAMEYAEGVAAGIAQELGSAAEGIPQLEIANEVLSYLGIENPMQKLSTVRAATGKGAADAQVLITVLSLGTIAERKAIAQSIQKAGNALQKLIVKLFKGGCSFVAGTLVATSDGYVPIEELKSGDLILSKSDKTGEEEEKPINAVFVEEHEEVYKLAFEKADGDDEKVITTAEHPFMVKGRGWIPAAELELDDKIETLKGRYLNLKQIDVVKEKQLAYNFEVDDFHTYSVTESELWVHNTCVPWTLSTSKKVWANKGSASRHLTKHGHEFGVKTQEAFTTLAKSFSSKSGDDIVQLQTSSSFYKFEKGTNTMFIGNKKGKIVTFYKWDGRPDAAIDLLKEAGKL